MKLLNLEQNTKEWFLARKGIATASAFKNIVTSTGSISKSINSYGLSLAGESILQEIEEGFKSEAMDRGTELEDEAIQIYQEFTFNKVDRVGFILCDGYGYSPDGLIGDDGLIEVKCPLYKNHTKWILEDRVPLEYYQQVQGGLYVSGRKWCDFVSYNSNFIPTKKIFIKRAYRDEPFIEKLQEGLKSVLEIKTNYLNKLNNIEASN